MNKPDYAARRTATLEVKPIKNCPECMGAGWTRPDIADVTDPKFGTLIRCESCAPAAQQERISRLIGQSGLEESREDLPDRPAKHFANYQPRYGQEEIYTAAKAFAAEPRGMLLLTGEHGGGKTTVAQCVGNWCLDAGRSVLYRTVPELIIDLKATFADDPKIPFDQLFEEVTSVDLLILDELGREHPTSWVNEQLYVLFDRRWRTMNGTVVTSNFDVRTLEAAIRTRLMDQTVVRHFEMEARNAY